LGGYGRRRRAQRWQAQLEAVPITRHTLAAAEWAAVRSWPALETADIDGWLWRYASGGSLRANSVAALAFSGASVEAAVAEAERRYRQKGAPSRFTVAEVSVPGDLDRRLDRLGYIRGDDHVTMMKEVTPTAAMPGSVEASTHPTPEWMAIYLSGLSADRKAVAPALLAGLPAPRTFLACRRQGAVVGSGLTIADGELASVQCMATLPAARRQGCAQAVLAAIEAQAAACGCRYLYLQTECANVGAVALYQGFGFHVAGRYHLRWKS
jgi:ribosomal protein S18 acetylase RimI-like enzyme